MVKANSLADTEESKEDKKEATEDFPAFDENARPSLEEIEQKAVAIA